MRIGPFKGNSLKISMIAILSFPILFFYQNCQGPSSTVTDGVDAANSDLTNQEPRLLNSEGAKGFDILVSNSTPLEGEPVDIEIRALDANMALMGKVQGSATVVFRRKGSNYSQPPQIVENDICEVNIPFVNGIGRAKFRPPSSGGNGGNITIIIKSQIPSFYSGHHITPEFSSNNPWLFKYLTPKGDVPSKVETAEYVYDNLSNSVILLGDRVDGYNRNELFTIKVDGENLNFTRMTFTGPVTNYGPKVYDPYLRQILLLRTSDPTNGYAQELTPELWSFKLDTRDWKQLHTSNTLSISSGTLRIAEFDPNLKSITVSDGITAGALAFTIRYNQQDPRWIAISNLSLEPSRYQFIGGLNPNIDIGHLDLRWECDTTDSENCTFRPRLYPKIQSCSLP